MSDAIALEAIDQFYKHFTDKQQELAGTVENHDIYEKRLTEPDSDKWPEHRLTPHSMYFYYVRINRDGRLVVDHYLYFNGDENEPDKWKAIPYDKDGLTTLVTDLAVNARPRTVDKNPRCRAKGDFKKTTWRRKSYIAIFFDEANWTLRKKTPTSGEAAVTFIVKEGMKEGLPNHSFFDAIDLTITIEGDPPGDERSAIVFVNHMKGDDHGNDIGTGVTQSFVFKLILDVETDSGDPPTVVIIDPGGDNNGPPLPPPP